MLKADKVEFVNELTDKLKSATTIVLVDYMGLDVAGKQDLGRKLKNVDAQLIVVKNTLFKLVGANIKAPTELIDDSVLSGPTALVVGQGDPIAPLQVLAEFAKEKELPQLKVGLIEGSFQTKESLVALSKLPGKDALVGQVLGSLSSPLYGIVGTLNAPMQKLIYVLTQASQK